MPGTILIGYDVELMEERDADRTRRFLSTALDLHQQLMAPCTMFVCGKTLELSPDHFRDARDRFPAILDIQQHTYSHVRFKSVFWENDREKKFFPGGTLEQITDDVARAQEVHERILGTRPKGVCGPYCYYRGLCDRPDMLDILHEQGIKFARTLGRDQWDWQPTPHSFQPFWYKHQGFPDILEIPAQGWQDCQLRDEIGWNDLEGFLRVLMESLGEVADNDWVWSACFHDWSSITEDPDMTVIRRLIQAARDRGVVFKTHLDYYKEAQKTVTRTGIRE